MDDKSQCVDHPYLCLFIEPRLDAMLCKDHNPASISREDLPLCVVLQCVGNCPTSTANSLSLSCNTITHSNREVVDTAMGSWSAT